jgi:hypothetical protein
MNYKAMGAPKTGRNAPRHAAHETPGPEQDRFGQRTGGRPSKAELLARMKAAKHVKGEDGSAPERDG